MPRVYTKTKSTRGKEYRCQSCSDPIIAGQSYHEWSRRFGRSGQTYRQHASHGRPRPTQLSSRKTAVLEEAVMDANFSGFECVLSLEDINESGGSYEIEGLVDHVQQVASEIAEVAREVGQEYQDGFDNMPEGLNQGPTAQAMEEVAQELESWADDLDDLGLDAEIDYPSLTDFLDNEDLEGEDIDALKSDWLDEVQRLVDEKIDEVANDAESRCSEYPEYQG